MILRTVEDAGPYSDVGAIIEHIKSTLKERGFQRGKRVQNFAYAKFKPVVSLARFFASVSLRGQRNAEK